MGCCYSSEGGSGRKEPAEKSQIAPAASDMAKSEVSKEAAHTDFISIHSPEKRIHCQVFTYEELYAATEGFRADRFLGEGGFGKVYMGVLDGANQFLEQCPGQVVAIKILNLQGKQGNREFLTEVLMLSTLHHPNLVKLVGYCADGNQRLLVYEYMPLGSLKSHLHDPSPDKKTLDWNTRMKILAGAAKGLQHLHVKVDPPVINRDVKCENILLGEGYHPKLSDFGLAKLGPTGDDTHVSTRVMGTPGYCAPEYLVSGQLTLKSDIYSFGVVMLEVITGRKAIDDGRGKAERNLAEWATPLVNKKDYPKLADPTLRGQYSMGLLYRALVVAKLCVNKTASQRPQITEVVNALTQISESHSRNARRSAHLRSSAPSTPTRTWREDVNQAEDQGESS